MTALPTAVIDRPTSDQVLIVVRLEMIVRPTVGRRRGSVRPLIVVRLEMIAPLTIAANPAVVRPAAGVEAMARGTSDPPRLGRRTNGPGIRVPGRIGIGRHMIAGPPVPMIVPGRTATLAPRVLLARGPTGRTGAMIAP